MPVDEERLTVNAASLVRDRDHAARRAGGECLWLICDPTDGSKQDEQRHGNGCEAGHWQLPDCDGKAYRRTLRLPWQVVTPPAKVPTSRRMHMKMLVVALVLVGIASAASMAAAASDEDTRLATFFRTYLDEHF